MSEDLTKKLASCDSEQIPSPEKIASIIKDLFLRISVINDTVLMTRGELLAVKERVDELEQHQSKPTNSST